MARFPIREGEIQMLANQVAAGLDGNQAIFPNPPVSPVAIDTDLAAFDEAHHAVTAAQAALEAAFVAKDTLLAELANKVKSDLRYAENTVRFNDEKLKLLGWSGRRARRKLITPGQPLELSAIIQGAGGVELRWKAPAEGGKTAVYKVQRRVHAEEAWLDVIVAMETAAAIKDQQRFKELEWRIVAVNKAGEGMPSNTVMTVL